MEITPRSPRFIPVDHGVFAALTIALVALLPTAASAAEKAKTAAPPPAKSAVMSQTQLRECMAQKDGLGQRSDAIVKTRAEVDAAKAEIDRTGTELSAAQATLDRTKKEDVDAYNAKLLARNALIDVYQAKAESFNKDVETLKASQESWTAACGNRRYDDRDLADIQKKK